jgi:5-methylcytosine-specific restriction endonuclease McrA
MPIRPENRARYPRDWQQIRARILLRACNCCEGTPLRPECRAVNHRPHPETGSKVILTIAHMDQQPENNGEDNLRALCQRCHNEWDAPHRAANAAITRHEKRGKRPSLMPHPTQ